MPTKATDIITRLWFDGRTGFVRHQGLQMDLTAVPNIGISHMVEIDFAPAMRVAQVRISGQGWRSMSMWEIDGALALCQRVVDAAHAVVA